MMLIGSQLVECYLGWGYTMIFNFVLLPIAIVAIGIFIIWVSIRRMRPPSSGLFRCGGGLSSVSRCQSLSSPLW